VFGIGAIILFVVGSRRFERFFLMDYQRNSTAKFKDNLVGNVYFGIAVACLLTSISVFQFGKIIWAILPLSLCIGGFIIPIGIIGTYWRVFMTNKLFGGFAPIYREKYGYSQTSSEGHKKPDISKIKIPRRVTMMAAIVALLVFCILFFILILMSWYGDFSLGIIIKLGMSGLVSFGVFIIIVSASLSHRIQQMRDGQSLDDND
jgi:hypothetical protein